MAEEEILRETAPASKKKDVGGFSFMHIIIIAVVLIVITAASTMLINKGITGVGSDLKEKIGHLETDQQVDWMKDRPALAECNNIVAISTPDKPMIVNLADGTHYLSVGISLCIPDEVKAEEFELKKSIVQYACLEYFQTLTWNDLFPKLPSTASGAEVKEKLAEGQGGGGLDAFSLESGGTNQDLSRRMDQIRSGLAKTIRERDIKIVKDVWFTQFLVQ